MENVHVVTGAGPVGWTVAERLAGEAATATGAPLLRRWQRAMPPLCALNSERRVAFPTSPRNTVTRRPRCAVWVSHEQSRSDTLSECGARAELDW